MEFDKATEIQLLKVDGVAAISKPLDGTNSLRVFLLTDTPQIRQAVLGFIGENLPHDKVFFEPQKQTDQCSFCGKTWEEVSVLITTNLTLTQGKTSPSSICFPCVAYFAQEISNTKDKSE